MALDSNVNEAYELKNELDVWLKTNTIEHAKTRLEVWMIQVEKSGNEAFKKVVQTLKRWKQEILQSFMYSFNNGYMEPVIILPRSPTECLIESKVLIQYEKRYGSVNLLEGMQVHLHSFQRENIWKYLSNHQ